MGKNIFEKSGVITNSQRGVWALTELGETIDERSVLEIPSKVRRADYGLRKGAGQSLQTQGADDSVDSDNELADWRGDLLVALKSITPDAFERLSQRILREAGFSKVEVTGKSGDGGIDGVGILRLNLLSFTTLFQCKRYAGSVGPGAIRDFRGAMVGRSDKGLIITTGTFTADARREATLDGAPAIELVDGDQLCSLLKDLKLGVETQLVERVVVNTSWFDQI